MCGVPNAAAAGQLLALAAAQRSRALTQPPLWPLTSCRMNWTSCLWGKTSAFASCGSAPAKMVDGCVAAAAGIAHTCQVRLPATCRPPLRPDHLLKLNSCQANALLPAPPRTHPPARSPLLLLRANETPYDQLPTVPPERLLPVLLELLRASLPTYFRFLTNLTRAAIQNHLSPFMRMARAFGVGERTSLLARMKPRAAAGMNGPRVQPQPASPSAWFVAPQ